MNAGYYNIKISVDDWEVSHDELHFETIQNGYFYSDVPDYNILCYAKV